jgi:AdoMet-dependent rRNA methyltransferase SPB1
MWVFQQLFEKVEATKPPASRNVSAEIFVVCKGFKAPKKLDPRLLDPKEVFEELADGPQNNEAKIYNPEKKVRRRQGYEEGDYLLYHELPILDFIKDEDPINTLATLNKLTLPDKDNHEWKIVKKLKSFTPELVECFTDLKVLGKKEFKHILKFRKQSRELLGIDVPEETKPEIEVEELTEDQKIDKELQEMTEKQRQKAKRIKKNANELKQKEIQRMQMNMLTDMNVGIDAAKIGSESLFNLSTAEKTGELDKLAKGKKQMVFSNEDIIKDNDIYVDEEAPQETDDELDALEAQLDDMYSAYQNRKAERDAKYRAKQRRGDDDDVPWEGLQSDKEESDVEMADNDDEPSSDSDDDEHISTLIAEQKAKNGLSRQASLFFASDPIFNAFDDDELLAEMGNEESKPNASSTKVQQAAVSKTKDNADSSDDSDDDQGFEIVKSNNDDDEIDISSSSDEESGSKKNHLRDVDLATVEAMTMAHQLALGQKSKNDLVNEGINKYSFRDQDGLPDWFVDEEKKHSKITKSITKEAAAAIKEKQRQLNARPIKKVLEAQGRKKMRALKRLEKLKKKSDLINEDSAKSEADKADEIQKLMRKMTKKQARRPKATVVVARGSNKGLSGRPKGVKGKYKMVDGVLKNEQRALRRIAKKHRK